MCFIYNCVQRNKKKKSKNLENGGGVEMEGSILYRTAYTQKKVENSSG